MFLRSVLLLASVTATTARLLPSSPMDSMGQHIQRRLQDVTDLGNGISGGTCANGTFTFTDDGVGALASVAFDDSFQPVCTCSGEGFDNLEDLADTSALDQTNLTTIVDDFNELIGSIDSESESSCVNTCETCYEGGTVCAILETSSSSKIAFMDGEFTLETLFALIGQSNDTDALVGAILPYLEEFYFKYELCLTYTKGETGTTCLSIDVTDLESIYGAEELTVPCQLTYDDTSCSSCMINTETSCLTASCPDNTEIDTCSGTGLEGPYQFLNFLYSDSDTDVSELSVGSCDVDVPPPSGGGGGGGGGTSTTSGFPATSLWATIVVVLVAVVTV